MNDLNIACFFAGAFAGLLGTLALVIWAATRIKKKDTAEQDQTKQKTE